MARDARTRYRAEELPSITLALRHDPHPQRLLFSSHFSPFRSLEPLNALRLLKTIANTFAVPEDVRIGTHWGIERHEQWQIGDAYCYCAEALVMR